MSEATPEKPQPVATADAVLPPPRLENGSGELEPRPISRSSPQQTTVEAAGTVPPQASPSSPDTLLGGTPATNAGGDQPPSGENTTQTHAHTIGSTQTYQGQQQTINHTTTNYNYAPEAKAAAAPPQENTPIKLEPLPKRPERLKRLRVKIPPELASGPEKHRVILISAFQQEISLAAAYSLIEATSLSSYIPQALVLDSAEHRNNNKLNIDLFNSHEFQGRNGEVVVVDIDREGVFLDSLRNIGILHASGLGESLRKRETVVICSLTTKTRHESTCEAFFHWHVEFFPAALLLRFSDEEAEKLHTILKEQQRANLWATASEEFCQQIWAYLQKGGEALRSEVERRQGFSALPLGETLDKIQPIKAAAIFRAESAPHAVALYTAVYFPGLTPQDFTYLVREILGEQTTTVEVEEQSVNRRGEMHTLRKKVEKQWAALWLEGSDLILYECRLEGVAQGDGTHIIEFKEPYLRRELRAYLEASHPMFVLRTFDRLLQLRLLFSPNVSNTIADVLIRLTVERTVSDPAYFGKDRLILFVIGMGTRASLGSPSSLGEELARLVLQEHFYDRLSQLIREMLQRASLRATVRSFLENLMEIDDNIAQDLLFSLLDRLRFEPQFQGLAWIQLLLDRRTTDGRGGVRAKVYERLITFTMDSGSWVHAVLEDVAKWLPDPNLDPRKYTPSKEDALRLLGDYFFYSLGRFPSDCRGAWPTQYDLFASLPLDPATRAEWADRLAGWLTHPGMKWILARDPAFGELSSDPEKLFLTVIAYFVEEWLLILEGVGPKPPAKEASALAHQLLRAVAARLDEDYRRKLVRGWQARQQEYVQQVNLLPVRERSRRDQILTRRRKLLELQQRFQSLPIDSGAARRRDKS